MAFTVLYLAAIVLVPLLTLPVKSFSDGWGFFWSTVVLYHCTFFINSLAHVHGNQRYVTGDDSRNNWWLAIITMGEGWHNNHHAFPGSARLGVRDGELDPGWWVLSGLRRVGLIWNVKTPETLPYRPNLLALEQ